MTAPIINGTRYPQPVDALVPAARELARELGELPSRNRLMREYRIGAPKAEELLARLRDDEPPADPWLHAEPLGPEPAVPGSTAPTEPDPAPAAEPNPAGLDPQLTEVGHPGTPPVGKPAPVVDDEPVTPPTERAELRSLKRVRWAVRGVLALGVAASIAGNVLHARDDLISQIISAWSPLALLLTIELISRVPVHRRHLAVARWAATAVIAGIAAWVSYWHMASVASEYGETGGSQYLIPLSVDGLVVVASICLVELGGRISAASKSTK